MAVNLDDITSLARDIGPRLPGTGKERRAAHYVMQRMRDLGIAAGLLPVKTAPSFIPIYFSIFAIISVAVPLVAVSRFLGLLISVFGGGLLVLELINRPLLSGLFATRRSHNVLGIIPAGVNDEIGEPARRVILTAHIDTGRGGLLWHRSLLRSFRVVVLVVLGCALAVPIVLLAYTIRQTAAIWIIAWVLMAILLLGAILMAESEWRGVPLAGANDNASGIAVLLAIASALRQSHLTHVETWFLFTTGEEAGLVGMNRFLDQNTFNPNSTYFVTVDHVGSGQIHFTRGEGLIRSRRSSAPLVRLISDIASHHPEWKVTSEVHRLLPTDQYAALSAGYQAVTILGLDENSVLPHWHQSTDTQDRVSPETMQIAADLTLALVRRLDLEVRDRGGVNGTLVPTPAPDIGEPTRP